MNLDQKRRAIRRLVLRRDQIIAELPYMDGLVLLSAVAQASAIQAHIGVVRATPAEQ